jgi:hypothetical protein
MFDEIEELEEKVYKIFVDDDERDGLDKLAQTLEKAELIKSNVTTIENCEGALNNCMNKNLILFSSILKCQV